jgi:hypothetical protein
VKRKLMATLLPVVAFAVFAIAPALAQAEAGSLYNSETGSLVPKKTVVLFKTSNFNSWFPIAGLQLGCAAKLTGDVKENPGARVGIYAGGEFFWEANKYCPSNGGPSSWYFKPSAASEIQLGVTKVSGTGSVTATGKWRYDFYTSEGIKFDTCTYQTASSSGTWPLESSSFSLNMVLAIIVSESQASCEPEMEISANFAATIGTTGPSVVLK